MSTRRCSLRTSLIKNRRTKYFAVHPELEKVLHYQQWKHFIQYQSIQDFNLNLEKLIVKLRPFKN